MNKPKQNEVGMLKIKKLSDDMIMPKRMERGSSGVDLFSPIQFYLYPGELKIIKLGFAIEIPYGFEWQIRPRSSMSKKDILTPFGTIDSSYRGDIGVFLKNLSMDQWLIERGDRIAQAVLCPVNMDNNIVIVDELSETVRGIGGFGSTGK
jgi:dUTP pyrophosphatase